MGFDVSRFYPLVIAVTAACYSPSPRDCAYACAGDKCPSGLACDTTGMCREPGAVGACAAGGEAGQPIDAVEYDAPTSCTVNDIHFLNVTLAQINAVSTASAWTPGNGATYNTDTGTGSGSPPMGVLIGNLRLIHVASFTVDANRTLTISGSTPLVIAADAIAVKGTIDWTPFRGADSHANCPTASTSGAGTCATGGGAGGTAATLGGPGGDGPGSGVGSASGALPSNPTPGTNPGGLPGATVQLSSIEPLTEGCQGAGQSTVFGGGGGGALQLVALTINVTAGASINLVGGGGDPGLPNPVCTIGGGGGGGGGALILNACAVSTANSSTLCATGGGGGGGANPNAPGTTGGLTGNAGLGCIGGRGGSGGNAANGGGNGAGVSGSGSKGGNGSAIGDSGGGGGGGTGRIRIEAGYIQAKGNQNPNAVHN